MAARSVALVRRLGGWCGGSGAGLRVLVPRRDLGHSPRDGAAAAAATALTQEPGLGLGVGHGDAPHPEVNLFDKNPEYHGFSADPVVDVWNMRLAFFCGISLAIVVGSVFVYYLPDRGMRQWARREAERQLKQREAEGLPAIGVNYFNPDRITLPPEGEE
ncbi:NADH dehydrogenase [ubiquinone] 1 beta subcomplex subunit 11, mitochondrial [Pristis pectinata]|uniref:NADH dehydrogenase [ubiquinone] 1 beta subcomplex subunit 11, mitochondrial n=1 Tax=Pristis pectinata TaxID=685728 RepID=UPI00223DBE1F|nr:NADH dehydrogenase [ubiquinone] 1 beta subcomplex subunit 11, mitochondrial [Pristis pectinata]